RLLEELEQLRSKEEQSRLDLAEIVIKNEMRVELTTESSVDSGLRAIEKRRLTRTIERYVQQHEAYEAIDPGVRPVPHRFEVVFVHEEDDPSSFPSLPTGA